MDALANRILNVSGLGHLRPATELNETAVTRLAEAIAGAHDEGASIRQPDPRLLDLLRAVVRRGDLEIARNAAAEIVKAHIAAYGRDWVLRDWAAGIRRRYLSIPIEFERVIRWARRRPGETWVLTDGDTSVTVCFERRFGWSARVVKVEAPEGEPVHELEDRVVRIAVHEPALEDPRRRLTPVSVQSRVERADYVRLKPRTGGIAPTLSLSSIAAPGFDPRAIPSEVPPQGAVAHQAETLGALVNDVHERRRLLGSLEHRVTAIYYTRKSGRDRYALDVRSSRMAYGRPLGRVHVEFAGDGRQARAWLIEQGVQRTTLFHWRIFPGVTPVAVHPPALTTAVSAALRIAAARQSVRWPWWFTRTE